MYKALLIPFVFHPVARDGFVLCKTRNCVPRAPAKMSSFPPKIPRPKGREPSRPFIPFAPPKTSLPVSLLITSYANLRFTVIFICAHAPRPPQANNIHHHEITCGSPAPPPCRWSSTPPAAPRVGPTRSRRCPRRRLRRVMCMDASVGWMIVVCVCGGSKKCMKGSSGRSERERQEDSNQNDARKERTTVPSLTLQT